MSLNTEKYALRAFLQGVLAQQFPTATENVFLDVLDEPYNGDYPAIVLRRLTHRTEDLYTGYGSPSRGNDPARPNIYRWEYYDQLVSESGSTLQETMDAHDDFLEALNVALCSQAARYLPDALNERQVEDVGAIVESVSNPDGPYIVTSGAPSILSSGSLTVQQKLREV
jgi:hypothetical protein